MEVVESGVLAAYLGRLGFHRPPAPTRETLDLLVSRHLAAVPFENLDVHDRRPIRLETGALVDKIVQRQRGGFCFEVNEAFRALLAALGYRVRRIEGRVFVEATQSYGAPFDHLALVVEIDDTQLLVDVGFGDNNRLPIAVPDGRHADISGQYRVRHASEAEMLVERVAGGAVRPLYCFTLAARELSAFEAMCQFHQSSPHSIFTKGLVCTLPTIEGRITLTQRRLTIVNAGARSEIAVRDDVHLNALLRQHFRIVR